MKCHINVVKRSSFIHTGRSARLRASEKVAIAGGPLLAVLILASGVRMAAM
jgi:hypothetical protein